MNRFEQLIEYVINDDEQKARELFHDIVVEKSREIYENLMNEENLEEESEHEKDEHAEKAGREVTKDIEYDEKHKKNESVEESVEEGMEEAARIASLLSRKEINAVDMYNCMIALKLSRQAYNHKEDNLLDCVAYMASLNDYQNKTENESKKNKTSKASK